MTAAPAIKKTDFQKSCKKNVQDPQLVLVERLASPYRQSIASALRLAVRTSPFHGENRGSIPLGRASDFNGLAGIPHLLVKYSSNKTCVDVSESQWTFNITIDLICTWNDVETVESTSAASGQKISLDH